MYIVKKIDIKSFAKIVSLFNTIFLLIPWLFMGIMWIFASRFLRYAFGNYSTRHAFSTFILPIIIWLLIPLVIALISFLIGLLFAWLYNIITKRIGGLKVNITLENIDKK